MKFVIIIFALISTSRICAAQNVGIGTNSPLTNLYIYNGPSGVKPSASSPLVIENNDHTYINILTPPGKEGAILFAQPGSADNGVLLYNTKMPGEGDTKNSKQMDGQNSRLKISSHDNYLLYPTD